MRQQRFRNETCRLLGLYVIVVVVRVAHRELFSSEGQTEACRQPSSYPVV